MVGKQLSALLQILRSQGVTEYATKELTLKLGPAPAPRVSRSIDEVLAQPGEDDDAPPEDFRFGLEKTARRFFPAPKADPTKARS